MTFAAVAATTLGKWLREFEYSRVLVSFAYDTKKHSIFNLFDYPLTRMLDSGAYSAFSKGQKIDLDEYIAWAKESARATTDPIRVTNLDSIPGDQGFHPTKREINRAVKQSAENAMAIRESGLLVCEVFHLFEPLSALEAILERRQEGEAIGMGGLGARVGAPTRQQFGDSVFSVLRDTCGWDKLPPVHGFGVGSSSLALRYPLASCDASTWLAPHRWGMEVSARGKVSGRRQKRMMVPSHAQMHVKRMLDGWLNRERSLAALWKSRGIRILPENPRPLREESKA